MPIPTYELVNPESNSRALIELKRLAVQRTRQLVHLSAAHFRVDVPEPAVRFDLRGKAAGQARVSRGSACVVRYNPDLLARNPEDFLASTVPHETAHIVAFEVYGHRIKPHGREWQAIMRLLGAEPRRCHDYDVEDLQARRLSRYHYLCGCGSHQLTSIRHNRILEGRVYLCRRCGLALRRAGDIDREPGS